MLFFYSKTKIKCAVACFGSCLRLRCQARRAHPSSGDCRRILMTASHLQRSGRGHEQSSNGSRRHVWMESKSSGAANVQLLTNLESCRNESARIVGFGHGHCMWQRADGSCAISSGMNSRLGMFLLCLSCAISPRGENPFHFYFYVFYLHKTEHVLSCVFICLITLCPFFLFCPRGESCSARHLRRRSSRKCSRRSTRGQAERTQPESASGERSRN